MKLLTNGLLLFTFTLALAGLSIKEARAESPTCTEDSVQQLVMQITYEELFTQLLPSYVQANYEAMVEELEGTEIFNNYMQEDSQGIGFVYGTLPVDYFVEFAKVSSATASVQEELVKQIEEMGITVNAVRVTSKQPELKKVTCAAQLAFANGNNLPIEYSAQYTEDEQVWVEVSGLK